MKDSLTVRPRQERPEVPGEQLTWWAAWHRFGIFRHTGESPLCEAARFGIRQESAPHAAIVNQSMSRHFWPNQGRSRQTVSRRTDGHFGK